ncbi:MAG TPA: hypothetical protein VMZ27_11500, partial [Candidatus Saccharimonadales bacterium]|nr:hypothetical protein [Candidatus Saccharimonadales bacterium]
MTIVRQLIVLTIAFLLSSLGSLSRAAEPNRIKALIVTGGHGFEKAPFFKVFDDNPEITYTAATQGKSSEVYERSDLLTYD